MLIESKQNLYNEVIERKIPQPLVESPVKHTFDLKRGMAL